MLCPGQVIGVVQAKLIQEALGCENNMDVMNRALLCSYLKTDIFPPFWGFPQHFP